MTLASSVCNVYLNFDALFLIDVGVGTSESGAEFGSALPGTLGTDYTWPETSKIQVLRNKGMNIFRIPFLMERLTPDGLTGSFASTYLSDLKSVCCRSCP